MGVILDTCVWIARMQGKLEPEQVAAVIGDAPVFVSVITLGELRFGAEVAGDPAERAVRAARLRLIERRPVLPITADTAASFGIVTAAVKQAGRSPRPRFNDLWIAAQAVEHGYGLLTLNPADFAGLPGLRLLTPAD